MRVTTAFCRLLRLDGVRVTSVVFAADRLLVSVALRRRRLVCPCCSFSIRHRERVQAHESVWRHLDLGVWRLEIRATLRQLRCPAHGVHVEAVPFARHRAQFTRDLEDLVAWLATRTDKTAITRLVRIDWQTVGRIISRVADEQLDERRLDDLFEIGIDEIAWRGGHHFLTLVTDHRAGKIVWGGVGRSAATADEFFAALDPPGTPDLREVPADAEPGRVAEGAAGDQPSVGARAAQLTTISMDMGPGYAKSAREHAPQAVICIDPYHVVQLANRALDEVRRDYWNELRDADQPDAARRFKDARWALLKNPDDHTTTQAATCASSRTPAARSGAPTRSRKRCARSSTATWTSSTSRSCWSASSAAPPAAAFARSCAWQRRSASTPPASSPRSEPASTTAASKRSTTKHA